MTEAAEAEKAKQRSFTGNKLDWLTAVMGDARLHDARAFKVAFCIAQHVNQETGTAILSDETIGHKTCIPRTWILRARKALRECGWIDWKRTKTANVYWTLGDHMNSVMDRQSVLKGQRIEARARRAVANQVAPPVAHLRTTDGSPVTHLGNEDEPPATQPDAPPVAQRDVPPVANIHLDTNTVAVTPSIGRPSIEEPYPAIEHQQIAETRLIEVLGHGDADRGIDIAFKIGDARFNFLRAELQRGSLYPSAVRAAACAGSELRNGATER